MCGPMPITTPSGNRYFFTLINDYSRFTVIRLLNLKAEIPGVIKEYITKMSVRFGRKPIPLRTDNGKKYISSKLTDFLKKEGIQH